MRMRLGDQARKRGSVGPDRAGGGYRGFHGAHRPYQGGLYGDAVLTRLPVLEVVTHPIPPASGSALSVLEVRVATDADARASVVSVHLAGSVEERLAQAVVAEPLASDHRPIVAVILLPPTRPTP